MKWLFNWFKKAKKFGDDGLPNCRMTEEEIAEAKDYSKWSKYRPLPEDKRNSQFDLLTDAYTRTEIDYNEIISELHVILQDHHEYWTRHKRIYVSNHGPTCTKKALEEFDHNIDSIIKMNELLVKMHGYDNDIYNS